MEVSEAVMISASVPILFRATNLDGEDYNDGGVLNNFPTEAFHGDNTTFLESLDGNNLKILAVQFDNGTERATVDRIKDRVHKEHFIFNWILGIMTGVNIPDGGWEKDRLKLRKYSAQSIIVNVANISATNFSVDEDLQQKLIRNGEQAANDYIKPRYTDNQRESPRTLQYIHETFSSLEELLAYCCYVGNETRFNTVCDLINESSEPNKKVLLKRAEVLKELYFSPLHQEEIKLDCSSNRIDEQLNARLLNQEQNQFNSSSAMIDDQLNIRPQSKNLINGHKAFIAIYPVILKLSAGLIKNKLEHFLLTKARHSFTKNSLFECLDYFNSIESELHIVFYIFIELIKVLQQELKKQSCIQSDVMVQSIYNAFKVLEKLLVSKTDVFKSNDLFGLWKIPLPQGISILNELATIDRGYAGLKGSCDLLRKKHQPVPIVTQTKSQDQDEKISFVSCL
jgi:NTE family protein